MIVLSVSNCPMQLRGDLTKWLNEIDTGVYVGQISARVREKIWNRVCDYIKTGKAVMVYSTNNEQGYTILTHNTVRKPIDYDGITLMYSPIISDIKTTRVLKRGFSKATRYNICNRKSAMEKEDIVILDIETTGLNYSEDQIIEIGMLRTNGNEIINQYQSYIVIDRDIPQEITKLTGITNDILKKRGKDEKKVIDEVINYIGDCKVIGYNIHFDINFINKLCEKYGVYPFIKKSKDVLKMLRKNLNLDSYKLEAVGKFLGFDISKIHSAVDDCILIFRILNKLNIKM